MIGLVAVPTPQPTSASTKSVPGFVLALEERVEEEPEEEEEEEEEEDDDDDDGGACACSHAMARVSGARLGSRTRSGAFCPESPDLRLWSTTRKVTESARIEGIASTTPDSAAVDLDSVLSPEKIMPFPRRLRNVGCHSVASGLFDSSSQSPW